MISATNKTPRPVYQKKHIVLPLCRDFYPFPPPKVSVAECHIAAGRVGRDVFLCALRYYWPPRQYIYRTNLKLKLKHKTQLKRSHADADPPGASQEILYSWGRGDGGGCQELRAFLALRHCVDVKLSEHRICEQQNLRERPPTTAVSSRGYNVAHLTLTKAEPA